MAHIEPVPLSGQIPGTCSPVLAHYIIPMVALIFGATFLLIGVSAGGWLFYSVGGVVLALSLWGFRLATRQIQQQTVVVGIHPPPGITAHQNPLKGQNVIPAHQEDPAPPV